MKSASKLGIGASAGHTQLPAGSRPSTPVASSRQRVAYLINQYPKVSHSFIRREVRALERAGIAVDRYALRGWADAVPDPEDAQEKEQTAYLLRGGLVALLAATCTALMRAPGRLLAATALACRLGWRADRPWLVHFVYLAEACLLAQWMRARNTTHLHAHFGTNPAAVALLARALGGPPFSFTVHGPEEFDKPEALKLREKVSGSAFVVAISSYGRSQIFRWIDPSEWPKVHTVHCGIEPGLHAQAPSPPGDGARLVCVGRLCEQKGQMILLQAIRQLVDMAVPVKFVLAGDGEMREALEQTIVRLELQPYVHITGWLSGDRVREEILAARALVLPSFAEGLPVVLMEAMALGRPVVSTYVAGIPELVIDGVNGWLVPAGDDAALTEALKTCLAASPELLASMGAAAHGRALLRHSVDTEAAKLAALFSESAISSGHAP